MKTKRICPICGKTGGDRRIFTIRESWIQAGGFGSIPDSAWVHIRCDDKEQSMILSGEITIEQLWNMTTKELNR